MITPKRRFAQALIVASYIWPMVFIFDVFAKRSPAIPLVVGVLVSLTMIVIRGPNKERVFKISKLRRRGPFYYFPLDIS